MLNKRQIRQLKSLANTCEQKYQLGKNEVTETVIQLLENALEKHELIKVCLQQSVVDEKNAIAAQLERQLHCDCIQIIGGVLVFYRKNLKDPHIQLVK